jgi:hypothetical protein
VGAVVSSETVSSVVAPTPVVAVVSPVPAEAWSDPSASSVAHGTEGSPSVSSSASIDDDRIHHSWSGCRGSRVRSQPSSDS